ncbi:hypothetical protein CL628_01730 [bacterium]|nr:hypothetical protein [bacterium]|tara:strand:+ start:180 stop:473 length:294 start_codon:yes stop_codon:yes gene_type:complete
MRYNLRGKVWIYPGEAAWRFVNVSKQAARDIKENFGDSRRGFGSIPVTVKVGKTIWNTSIFPDSRSGTYLLPLKKEVRVEEGILAGKQLRYALTIRT